MDIRKKTIAASFALLGAIASLAAAPAATSPQAPEESFSVERYAIYVASNDGGPGRERLRYARTDAKRLSATMAEIGGIDADNSIMLVDPTKDEINDAFDTITKSIKKSAGHPRRTEFLFYYSGHSSESAIILGRETYEYGALKDTLTKVPSDVHVVMLDSCYSGNFVRAKGGSRQKPFLMDDSTVVQGHAYLSSSSELEESQESDTIQASYFTQALITGLRGAADASGDNKVSLNELYYYAFNETLAKTESSVVGPQHPSYNITLVGSGDLVLTDLSEAESVLHIPASFAGNFFIRNPDGLLVSEINKIAGTEVALALPAGTYTIAIVTATTTSQGTINFAKGQRLSLDGKSFSLIPRTLARSRGDAVDGEEATPFALCFFPGLSMPAPMPSNVNVSLGVFMADNEDISGIQASSFMASMSGRLRGVQAAGFMSSISGDTRGIQAAGFMNISSSPDLFWGLQTSGFLNNASGDINGGQYGGFLNEAKGTVQGGQVSGFLNDIKGDLTGLQGSGFINNVGGGIRGVQATGFINIAHSESRGAQFSGFLNSSKNFTGAQAAGFINIAGDVSGAQAAGFINIASSVSGAQAAGFINIAGDVSGAQAGFINIARSNSGVAIGFLNFIRDGVMSPSVGFDSDGNLLFQYQGGTNRFFTTILLGGKAGQDFVRDYAVFGFGIGTRVQAGKNLSFDIELLQKQILDIATLRDIHDRYGNEKMDDDDGIETPFESEMKDWSHDFGHCGIPSVRATANWMAFRHLGVFTGLSLDVNVKGFNDEAFTFGSRADPLSFASSKVKLYPTWSFGVRF